MRVDIRKKGKVMKFAEKIKKIQEEKVVLEKAQKKMK